MVTQQMCSACELEKSVCVCLQTVTPLQGVKSNDGVTDITDFNQAAYRPLFFFFLRADVLKNA